MLALRILETVVQHRRLAAKICPRHRCSWKHHGLTETVWLRTITAHPSTECRKVPQVPQGPVSLTTDEENLTQKHGSWCRRLSRVCLKLAVTAT